MTGLVMDELAIKHLYTSVDPNFNISINNVTKRAIEVLHKINIYDLTRCGHKVSVKIQLLLSCRDGSIEDHIKEILVYFSNTDNTNEKNILEIKRQIDRLNRLCSQCEVIIENHEKNSKLKLLPKNTKIIYFILGCLFTLSLFLIKTYFNL